jgi:hypothetical protein
MAENRFSKYVTLQRGGFIPDPNAAAEQERKAQDQANEQRRLQIAEQAARDASAAQARAAEAADRAALEWKATHFADGTPRPKADASAQANPDRIPQILSILDNIKNLRGMADDFYAVGRSQPKDFPVIGGLAEVLGFQQNRANVEGALQTVQGDLIQQQIARLSEMNGGKGVASIANSETEAARIAASIANLDPNQDLPNFTTGLDRAEQYYLRELARQEGADPNDPEVRKFYDIRQPGTAPAPATALTRLRMGNIEAPRSAPFGATEGQTVTIPAGLEQEQQQLVARLLQEGGGRLDPEAYAREFAPIADKYNFDPGNSAAWASDINAYLDSGGTTIPSGVQLQNRDLTGLESFRNSIVNNPVGATAASALNAGGLGIPSLAAGDQMALLREENPVSSFLGEVVGGGAGAFGAGRIVNEVAGGLAARGAINGGSETLARMLPMIGDAVYGGTYGATQAEDPVIGALIGAGSGAAGSWAGSKLGGAAPRITGSTLPDDPLGPAGRRVFDAAEQTGFDPVVAALQQADELGIPASLADVSPEVNSLTGAALRRSPTASGEAQAALGARSRGQIDRFRGAVERDLGPIANVPQRSEDLIAQARTNARPLYEAAYAAPGAENVNLADLADRPTFGAALREAYNEVLDEGLDPSAVGLQQVGDGIQVASPSWQSLDYVKRGLDNIIERNTSAIDGITPEGRRALAMKNELLGRMDALNPDYAAARQAYAGPAGQRAAMRQGQEAVRMTPDQLGVDVNNASPAQLEQMRLGFQSGLAENAGRLGNNTNPFRTLDNPAMEARLATMYEADPVANLLLQRDVEGQLAASTNRLLGNSATAERQIADQAFGNSSLVGDIATGAVETALTGAPVVTAARSGLGRGLAQGFRDWRTLGLGSRGRELAEGIAPLALDTNPENAAATLLDLATQDARYQQVVEALLEQARQRGGHAVGGSTAAITAGLLR